MLVDNHFVLSRDATSVLYYVFCPNYQGKLCSRQCEKPFPKTVDLTRPFSCSPAYTRFFYFEVKKMYTISGGGGGGGDLG